MSMVFIYTASSEARKRATRALLGLGDAAGGMVAADLLDRTVGSARKRRIWSGDGERGIDGVGTAHWRR
jgi:hypothetical protein